MENETDVIREQMTETRTALTEKLEALQEQVVATVQGTTDSVTETVQSVTGAVQETVTNVTEKVQSTVDSVKSTLDITRHVENHPWAMFGGAVVIGYLGGRMIPSWDHLAPTALTGMGAAAANSATSAFSAPATASVTPPSGSTSASSSGPSWMDTLLQAASPVLKDLEGMAVGALSGLVGEMVLPSAPEGLRPQLKEFLEQVTTSLGGKPMQMDWLKQLNLSGFSNQEGDHGARNESHPTRTAEAGSPAAF